MAESEPGRTENQVRGRLPTARLAGATGVGVVIAAVGSVAIYLVALAGGAIDHSVMLPSLLGMGPMGIASVAVTAVVATLAAGAVLALFVLTTRRPITYFRIAATVLALLSLAMPVTIPGPSIWMRVAMGAMHGVVWAVSVGILPAVARRGGGPR